MILLPQNGRWTQNNRSDIGGGSIIASKNIDLRTPGYVKMSDRVVSIKTEEGDSNFDAPIAINGSAGTYKVVTMDQPYDVSISSGISVSEDTSPNCPSSGPWSSGIYWQSRFYVADNTSFKYYASGSWTAVTLSPALTGSVKHNMCVFENRNSLVIGNGSQLKQINTSHADTVNLTIPSDYTVDKIAYNNNRVGFTSKASTGVKDSLFFTWDGSLTEANGGYSIRSAVAISVLAYKSSFIVINGNGEILYFNGSGFDPLDQLPIDIHNAGIVDSFPSNLTLGNMDTFVDGEFVYFISQNYVQVANGGRVEHHTEFNPGSVWAWSPDTGLHHVHCTSSSVAFSRQVVTANVNTTTDVITVSSTVPVTGTPVIYISPGSIIGGLKNRTIYYVINLSSTTLKLASSKTNALAGIAIDLTSTGHDAQRLTFYPENDFGQMVAFGRSGMLRKIPSQAYYNAGILHGDKFFGIESVPNSELLYYAQMNITAPLLENRSWIVTPRLFAQGILDVFKRIVVKHKPLRMDIDKIVVKYRTKDFTAINQPATISNNQNAECTWSSATTFTTLDDLSTVQVGYEVEIVGGAGAGQTAHVSSISENSGTYTVVLDETLIGVANTNKCLISVSNWKKIGTATTDTVTNSMGYSEFSIPQEDNKSKWIQFKIELRGVHVAIEQIQVIDNIFRSSI